MAHIVRKLFICHFGQCLNYVVAFNWYRSVWVCLDHVDLAYSKGVVLQIYFSHFFLFLLSSNHATQTSMHFTQQQMSRFVPILL